MADKLRNFTNSLFRNFKNKEYVAPTTTDEFFQADQDYLSNIDSYYNRKGLADAGMFGAQILQNSLADSPDKLRAPMVSAPEFSFSRDQYTDDLNRNVGGGYSAARDMAMKTGDTRSALGSVDNVTKAGVEGSSKIFDAYNNVVNKQRGATAQAENKNEQFRAQTDIKNMQIQAADNEKRSALISSGISNMSNSLFNREANGLETGNQMNMNALMQLAAKNGMDASQIYAIMTGKIGAENFDSNETE